jgi:hypothetical protein
LLWSWSRWRPSITSMAVCGMSLNWLRSLNFQHFYSGLALFNQMPQLQLVHG